MSYPLEAITVLDEHGTDYTDLFADLDLDEADLIGATHIESIDLTITNTPISPRSNTDGPLGALIERWITSHSHTNGSTYGWQYLDASDTHTIAWYDHEAGDIQFVNIFGYPVDGNRAYRLRSIAAALELRITTHLA